ncbi:MAG: hypothetical protein KGJ86_05590 [Chloroflexota bacterium]|nr:hypothetical protein [Chloroflexota bacterium]
MSDMQSVPTLNGHASDVDSPAPADWPAPLGLAAYHGLAGDIVRALEPHTEADPVALLAQFLVAYGNVIGRGAHRLVGATRHYTNEFLLLVGASAKSRKGSSWDLVEQALTDVDPGWASGHVQCGLTSGEGLIWHVRDALEQPARNGHADSGVADKRLLVLEPEFALVLRVLAREGNTLSAVVRNAWDGRPLQTMAKNSPTRATDAHVSVVGHITTDELLRYVNATELANGFLNRFLLLAVRRTKLLPEGGDIQSVHWAPLKERLQAAVQHAQANRALPLTDAARQRWVAVYPQLSAEATGLYGAVIARAEAHVLRVSLLYALLDCAAAVDRLHLDAALSLWAYAARSARWVFGDSVGDPIADDIWQALQANPHGLTRQALRDLFSRNKSAKAISAALAMLERAGRVSRATRSVNGHGRPAEMYIAATRDLPQDGLDED